MKRPTLSAGFAAFSGAAWENAKRALPRVQELLRAEGGTNRPAVRIFYDRPQAPAGSGGPATETPTDDQI